MTALKDELASALKELEARFLRRRLRMVASACGPTAEVEGREVILLCSNNYLDLANHPALRRAAAEAIERYGVGAGASRLISGSLEPLHQLEERLRRLKKAEAGLVFGSGYLANLGTITAVAGPGDVIISDELNHASLIDGCRLSRATVKIYRHCDTDHLEYLLDEASGARRKLIVTDSVFSMDGDRAPLERIVELARRHGASVMIDEAHAVGVIGPRGGGLAVELGLEDQIEVRVGTLSKALGAYGAYVVGSQSLIDFLVNRARSFIYTTGVPPALAAAAGAALEVLAAEPERIERLWSNAAYLRDAITAAGFDLGRSASPILPVMVGDSERALALAQGLYERGVFVSAIRPPTVPEGTARLRLTSTAGHDRTQLKLAVEALAQVGSELRLIRPISKTAQSR
jgi:8-amino-7-oxononanoate synthase